MSSSMRNYVAYNLVCQVLFGIIVGDGWETGDGSSSPSEGDRRQGTVLRLLQRETGDREPSPVSVLFILEKSLVFRHY